MGNGVSEVEEKGIVLVDAHEIERDRGKKIVRVLALLAVAIGFDREHKIVPVKLGGIIIVGMGLPQIAEPFVESFFVWCARCVSQAKTPFPDHPIGVARLFQNLRHRHILRLEGNSRIAPDAHVAGVQARHQTSAGGSADSAASIALSEAHSFGRQAVNVRSFDFRLPVTAEIPITKIIRQDKDNIGFVFRLNSRLERVERRIGGERGEHARQQIASEDQQPNARRSFWVLVQHTHKAECSESGCCIQAGTRFYAPESCFC